MDLGARQRTRQSWRRRAGSADVTPALAEVPVGDPARPAASFATPAVFRGLCSAWPACRWTEQSLARALPTVRVSRSRSGEYPRDSASGKPCPMETVPTARFLAALREGPPTVYVHGEVLPDALLADCPPPHPLLRGERVARRSLWLSGDGARSPLHYDLPMVLLCQLHGRKRVTLYSPRYHDLMRPQCSTWPALTAQERIAGTSLGAAELRGCEGLIVELRPGDALLMPSGWWHEVESVGDARDRLCASVGLNWPSIADALPAFASHRDAVRAYPVLTQGRVVAMMHGEAKARAALPRAQYDLPVFAE
ncbi:hypothetical protein EMIHUDRAFT_117085 [Emiliania huxleyi CCMP1516]|uniref:JmjC domain-containing protein n=2 Tax=Emiliania huxleyi TaxID=2903 RepID=A0A0D3JDI0_EMIH1|nr:hypothetical protein EMIHUDRAFT_117085 [Emiliania huxleyi CCMP1516]EOD21565.1 hypothetical protein EMIHUDRAFT_117085 [Emiliania huxleyi CCMP1516]|mmetsp:Transcript_13364/g.43589  ORF Transcript_13364/g.43589 Transcript_13364/m.43589 type:complete len:309 (+) Transcript_13364:123-1049(+)|eukprot:XP_005773994.1 hypothetical protein EMIHUDRAFT_117085 [Emiliania huxleyi CCMP1516]